MSIASEITRIQGNVSDSLTAVANKGVTVPAGSNSDDLAGLIALIQTGGGGGTVTWETMYDASTWISSSNPNYFIISDYTTPIQAGETYRVTWGTGGTQYVCETFQDNSGTSYDGYVFGNLGLVGYPDYNTGEPFFLYRDSATRLLGVTNASGGQNIFITIEKQITSGGGSATLITKNITANGTYNASSDSADGYSSVVVNVPTSGGGESGDYTRTVVFQQQSVACATSLQNNAYYALLQSGVVLDASKRYIVTYDGTEYVCEGYTGEANCITLGDINVTATHGDQRLGYPFYISYEQSGTYFVVRGSGTHTFKIEQLDFITDGADADLPVFELSFDSNEDFVSATCNKTWAECYALYDSENTAAVAKLIYPPGYVTSEEYIVTVGLAGKDIGSTSGSGNYDYIDYVYASPTPIFDVRFRSNGSIYYTSPSSSAETLQVTNNGTYSPDRGCVYTEVNVNVSGGGQANLQAKTNINPTTSSQTIQPDSGYDGLSSVQINAIPTGTVTAPSSINGTSATVSTGTNTLTLTKSVSVTPNVTTAGYVSSGTAGNASVSLTASVTTKAAATITPGTTAQTIAAGTYITGAQTIAGDSNLVSGNILSGKTIFGVQGGVSFQTYYTGSSTPSSSLGVNGDIYLQS